MKTALIFQSSKALGDRLFITWMPKYLKRNKGFDKVYCATWKENACFWDNNPFVNGIIELETYAEKKTEELLTEWGGKYTEVYDIRWMVEGEYLKLSTEPTSTLIKRREKAKGVNYYNCYQKLGLNPENPKPDLYLTDAEKELIKKYKDEGKTRIAWQLQGSGRNKQLIFLPGYILSLAERYKEIEQWVVGDAGQAIEAFEIFPNIKDMRGKWTVRQSMVMANIFDLIVGPESYWINVAGAFDIPSLCFYSMSSPDNLTRYFNHAHSIIPKCECSPCYLICKDFRQILQLDKRASARDMENDCIVRNPNDYWNVLGYKCTVQIDHRQAIDKIISIVFDRKRIWTGKELMPGRRVDSRLVRPVH